MWLVYLTGINGHAKGSFPLPAFSSFTASCCQEQEVCAVTREQPSGSAAPASGAPSWPGLPGLRDGSVQFWAQCRPQALTLSTALHEALIRSKGDVLGCVPYSVLMSQLTATVQEKGFCLVAPLGQNKMSIISKCLERARFLFQYTTTVWQVWLPPAVAVTISGKFLRRD